MVCKISQQKRVVRRYQEYPGSVWHEDYEILCPECNRWSANYGNVDQLQENGEWWYLCVDCGEKVVFE